MWQIIRIIVSLLLSVEMIFGSLFSGSAFKKVRMPELQTGEYTRYVDPFIGTGGTPWTCAMLSPAATVPFGCVRLGADTCAVGGLYLFKTNTSGYYYEHRHIIGFSYSRLSGTGVRDYGIFRVTPFSGVQKKKPAALPFSHCNEIASAGYYAVYLPTESVLAEMTATEHTGWQRYTFDTSRDAKLYIDAASTLSEGTTEGANISVSEDGKTITAEVTVYGGFSGRFDGLKAYYYAETDTAIKSFEMNGTEGVCLNFGNVKGKPVEIKAGISFASLENAKGNLAAEAGDADFDSVRKSADEKWNAELSKIKITANEEIKTNFYTSLYHTMIMPTNFTDYNGEYVGFDKQTHTADGYTYRTDMSLWDTSRNVNALYCLIEREVQNDCIQSLLDMADKGGVLPRWPMGEGYTGSMLGCPANMVLTESLLKGFDFDTEKALDYMIKSATTFDNKENREYSELYDEYGYVPDDLVRDGYRGTSVSRTVEYSWADAAISTFAAEIGRNDVADEYYERSMRYKNVWNPETKYFQARNSDGGWGVLKPNMTAFYDEVLGFKFSKAYCEGSARQWRWSAMNDIDGMIELFGSKEYFVSELDDFMKDASLNRAAFNPGAGYWIGNQHDIHTPYLFINADRPDLTQKWVRWTLDNRFSTDINGLDGNDDGGTLSSWYVFSSMGIYPVAGTAQYWIGSPCVDSAEMALSGGKILTVRAENQSAKNIYVDYVTLNGTKLDSFTINHSDIENGGELVFYMKSARR